jgi:hypothetical protein
MWLLADADASSAGALSAFGGGRKDHKNTTGRYPTTPPPIDVKF